MGKSGKKSSAADPKASASSGSKRAKRNRDRGSGVSEASDRSADEAAVAEVAVAEAATPDGFSAALRVGPGFRLADLDPRATPGFTGTKSSAEELHRAIGPEVADLQERLYAQARAGIGQRSLLLLVQGMDTSGKGGLMRHVVGQMDPQGVDITAFKQPTAEERAHPFLWRIRRALPEPGRVMVFDRSQYEDVLVVRVNKLVPASTWMRRYGQINTFEASAAKRGITQIKVMLHISKEEQKERLAQRLERPDKHWKYNPGDIDQRLLWEDYQAAYQTVLDKTSTEVAPWFVVPADRKWYARLAVANLVLEHLRAMDLSWPVADFDVAEELQRLAQS